LNSNNEILNITSCDYVRVFQIEVYPTTTMFFADDDFALLQN